MSVTMREQQAILSKHPTLTKDRLEEFREAFALFDTDGNGNIDATELQQVMNRVGGKHFFDHEAVTKMINTVDTNKDGHIDFFEFVDLMSTSIKSDQEELRDAFQVFDVDGDGKITSEEIQKVLSEQLGQHITQQEIEFIMADVDTDGDGHVDFSEFEAMMLYGPKKK